MKEREKKMAGNVNNTKGFASLKFLLLASFLAILVFPLASAVSVTMDSNFSQGGTLLAVVSGNFIDQITPDNVVFYRGHNPIAVSNKGVVNINGDFYVYALLTNKSSGNNYYMNISGVRYMKATSTVHDPILANFTITNDTAAFSIDPGAVSTENNFSVSLQNLEDNQITVSYGINQAASSQGTGSTSFFDSLFGTGNTSQPASQNSVTMKTGEAKTLSFSPSNFTENGTSLVTFSSGNYSYNLPVYMTSNTTIPAPVEAGLDFQPSTAYVPMATNSSTTRIIYIANTGNSDLENVSFNVSALLKPYVTISPSSISSLSTGSSKQVELGLVSDIKEAVIEGKITAYSGNVSSDLDLVMNFTAGFIPANSSVTSNQTILSSCSDLNGSVCSTDQTCSGNSVYAKDGVCCLSSCTTQSSGFSLSWIGWILLAIAIIAVIWFYKRKYKKVAPKKPF